MTDYVDDTLGRDTFTSSTNTYSCDGVMCGYEVITTYMDVALDANGQAVVDSNGEIVFTERMVESFSPGFSVPDDALPHCTGMGNRESAARGPVITEFKFDGVVLSRTTITCGGCECLDTMAGIPADWACCLISCPPAAEGGCGAVSGTGRQADQSTPENPLFWVLRAPGDCP
jgi:hypothetical protein